MGDLIIIFMVSSPISVATTFPMLFVNKKCRVNKLNQTKLLANEFYTAARIYVLVFGSDLQLKIRGVYCHVGSEN
jgi:hypothetical protein